MRNFSTLERGEAYSDERLAQFIRRLNASGYFASVQASIDPDPAQAHDATVTVSVIEALPRRVEGGLGFSTDTQLRGNFRYTDVNVDGKATAVLGRRSRRHQDPGSRAAAGPPAQRRRLPRQFRGQDRVTATSRACGRMTASVGHHPAHAGRARPDRVARGVLRRRPACRRRSRPSARGRCISSTSGRGARSTISSRPTRGFVLSVPCGRRPARRVDARLRPRRSSQYASWHPARPRRAPSTCAPRRARCSRPPATAFPRRCCFAPAATPRCAATPSRASASRAATRPSAAATTPSPASRRSVTSRRCGASPPLSTPAMPAMT